MVTLLQKVRAGGRWLSTARSWIQRKKLNGERVTWGSSDVLEPPMTVGELEEVVALAVEADRLRILQHLEKAEEVIGPMTTLKSRIEGIH